MRFLLILLNTLAVISHANAWELSVAPGLSQSSYSNLNYMASIGLAAPIADDWQFSGRISAQESTAYDVALIGLQIGSVYNFKTSSDLRAYVGAGLGEHGSTLIPNGNSSLYVYGLLGYLLPLSRDESFKYSPYLEINVDSDSHQNLEIQLLNFSYTF